MHAFGKTLVAMLFGLAAAVCAQSGGAAPSLPHGYGLAAAHPGDRGIAEDPAVALAEDFSGGDLAALKGKWSTVETRGGKALFLDTEAPAGSAAQHSLRIVATRGENEGGFLYRLLKPGYDRLFLRFYVKFARDDGFHSHFAYLRGAVAPKPWPMGSAGLRPTDSWAVGIDPTAHSYQTWPFLDFDPPGLWHLYTYWPEMRSWQNADGTGTSFYGNDFEPAKPVLAPRDRWICVETMVQLNSSPDKTDGVQALWIDGKLVGDFGPGRPTGRWTRDIFVNDARQGTPFAGFRWRTDPRAQINQVGIENYVSDTCFAATEAYAAAHPNLALNTKTSTVWYANVVVATEYIGPIRPAGK